MVQHCSDNTPMLPILVNYSTVMKNTTVRKCLDCLSGDVMMKSVQEQVKKATKNKNKNIIASGD